MNASILFIPGIPTSKIKKRPSTAGVFRQRSQQENKINVSRNITEIKSTTTTSNSINTIKQRPCSAPPKRPSYHFRTHLRRKKENSNLFSFVRRPPPLIRLPSVPKRRQVQLKREPRRKKSSYIHPLPKGTGVPYEWWESAAKRGDKRAQEIVDMLNKDDTLQINQNKVVQKMERKKALEKLRKPRFGVNFKKSRSCFGLYYYS
jgi:hypothetical protein